MTEQYPEGSEICKQIDDLISESEDYANYIGGLQERNVGYYLRRPRGDEVEGQSEYINADVADTVDGLMPGLMDVFMSGDPCEFAAQSAEDVPLALQATQVVNFVFGTQNNRFVVLHSSIKNGLLKKAGFVTWRWDDSKTVKHKTYKDLSEQQYNALALEEGLTVESVTKTEAAVIGPGGVEMMMPSFEVEAKVIRSNPRVCVENVPPDEILVHSSARSPDIGEIDFLCHQKDVTKTELLAMGYERKAVDEAMKHAGGSTRDTERSYRFDQYARDGKTDKSTVTLEQCYWRHDLDEDGVAEVVKVCKVGKYKLHQGVVDDIPYAAWSPKLLPDEFYGECPADDASDSQDLNTALMRSTLDSFYQSNTPRMQVLDREGVRVNMDDLLDVRPGGIVRVSEQGAIVPLIVPPLGQQALPLIELADARREQRTGVTRYNQGLDGDSLNQTASGIRQITTLAQQKQKLIAMAYAELLLKRVYKGILSTLAANQSEQMVIRLTNQFIPIDPIAFARDYDVTVNVGMGSASRDQTLMHLGQIAIQQEKAIAAGGRGIIVDEHKVYAVVTEMAKHAGFKDPDKFWLNPANAKPPPPPQPPLEMILQEQALKASMAQSQLKAQSDAQRVQLEAQVKQSEMALKRELESNKEANDLMIAQMRDQLERDKLNLQAVKDQHDMAMSGGLNQRGDALHAQVQQMMHVIQQAQASMASMIEQMQIEKRMDDAERAAMPPKARNYEVQRDKSGALIGVIANEV